MAPKNSAGDFLMPSDYGSNWIEYKGVFECPACHFCSRKFSVQWAAPKTGDVPGAKYVLFVFSHTKSKKIMLSNCLARAMIWEMDSRPTTTVQ